MTASVAHPSRKIRSDIQALRGFAVLVVLFYHAKISSFSAGYLGVDIFFVISGFLITGLVKKDIERNRFSFFEFYLRRAKRLIPAAYVTFVCCALIAPFILTSSEMKDFRAQMIGAVTFTANMVLWNQSGYFGSASELKPLLHVWSLAIEEQFYFILPALLVFVPRRLWLRGAMLLLLTSLVLCITRMGKESTFFLLPTRAWELMIGAVGALCFTDKQPGRLLKISFWPALIMLVALPIVKLGANHPGPAAILICLSTIVVIMRQHPLLASGTVIASLSKIGDMSYSIYLVHWPLFAFFNNMWLTENGNSQPLMIRAGLIALSLMLAFMLNRYIEEPARRADIKRSIRSVVRFAGSSASLIVLTIGLAHAVSSDKDYAYIRRINYGFGMACDFEGNFEAIQECRNSDRPEILFWGDSYAMHLIPGALSARGVPPSIVQATRTFCGPLLGVAPSKKKFREEWEKKFNQGWAKSCIEFNDSVASYLRKADSIGTVVLSSPFAQFIHNDENTLIKKNYESGLHHSVDANINEAVNGLKATIDTVRALGKRVVIISPPPASGADMGRCVERMENGLPVMGVADGCSISVDAFRRERGRVMDFLVLLQQKADVDVIRLDDYLCDSLKCDTYIDGTFIYRDDGHFSHEGSIFIANRMSLVDQIFRKAR